MNRLAICMALAGTLFLAAWVPGAGARAERVIRLDVDSATLHWARTPAGAWQAELPGGVHVAGDPRPHLPVHVLPPAGYCVEGVEVVRRRAEPVRTPGDFGALPGSSAGELIVSGGGYSRGTRLDGLAWTPLTWSPETGWMLTVELEFSLRLVRDPGTDLVARDGAGPLVHPRGPRVLDLRAPSADAPALAPLSGGAAFDPRHRPSRDGSPVEYVIVTSEALASELEPLAAWRTRSGFPAVVRTVEWIREQYPGGVDLAEKIRFFARDAVAYWGTEWLLLAGDTPIVPIREALTRFYITSGESIPTDMYYQCLDGDWNANRNLLFGEAGRPSVPGDDVDLVPDLWVGRLPVTTPAEARLIVEKILDYERSPAVDDDYPANMLQMAEVLFPQNWEPGDTTIVDGAMLAQAVHDRLPPGMSGVRYFENHVPYPGALPERVETIRTELNRGYGLVMHVGHGFHNTMSVGSGALVIPDADAMRNGPRTSVFYAINCNSAAIDFDSMAEHFLDNPDGGAVAYIGSTRFEFSGSGDAVAREFFDQLFVESAADPGLRRLGRLVSESKLPFVPFAQQDNSTRWTTYTLIYLGDPAMPIWLARPETLDVSHEDLRVGPGAIGITVDADGSPVEGARVTLWREDETYSRGVTGPDGQVILTIQPGSEGPVSITATVPDHLPYEGSVYVGYLADGYAVLDSIAVNDAAPAGNANACLEAGEAALLQLAVRNPGSGALTGVSVELTSPGSVLSVDGPPTGPSTIAGGATAVYTVSVTAGTGVVAAVDAPLLLDVASNEGTWDDETALPVSAPVLAVHALSVEEVTGDGDGLAEAGETVDLRLDLINTGPGATLDAVGTLSLVESGGESIDVGVATYGVIAGRAVTGQDVPFRVTLAGSNLIHFDLTVTDAVGQRLVHRFDLIPPAVPANPGAVGRNNAITVSWELPADPDVARFVVYRSGDESGPFTRINGFEESSFSFYTDDPLPGLAVRYYRVAAQDSSGHTSGPGPVVRGTTSLPFVPNFPLPTLKGSPSSVVAEDLDGDGVLDLITGREEIYGVHADGEELIDGDQDARTLGVWDRTGVREGYWATPAVGDLDGDGRLELVAVSKYEGRVYAWDARGQVLPGWPRATSPRTDDLVAWSSPVLADLTGDSGLEVVVQVRDAVYAFRHDGSEVRDGDDDPATIGVFLTTGSVFSYGTVAAADLDDDPHDELVVPTRAGTLHVVNGDGSALPGWPRDLGGGIVSSPALADLDGDGIPEIIVGTKQNRLEVLDLDGAALPGWPQPVLMNQDLDASPAVADVDDDGELEIAIVSGSGIVYLFEKDGSAIPGFPVQFTDPVGTPVSTRGTPALADLDGDPELEIVFGNQEGWVAGYNPDASFVAGFPLKLEAPVEGGVLVTDANGDGFNELAVAGFEPSFHLYRTLGRPGTNPGWTMFRHDPRNTGFVGTPVRADRTPQITLAVLPTPVLTGSIRFFAVSTRALQDGIAMTLDGNPLGSVVVDAAREVYQATWVGLPGSYTVGASGVSVDGVLGTAVRNFDVVNLGTEPVRAGAARVAIRGAHGSRLLAVRYPEREARALGAVVPTGRGERVLLSAEGTPAPGTRVTFESDEPVSVWHWTGSRWNELPAVARGDDGVTVAPEAWGWFDVRTGAGDPVGATVLAVSPARPNPASGPARVDFDLGTAARVRAEVFDLRGRRVRVLVDREHPAGRHRIDWDGRDEHGLAVPAGVYFVRVRGAGAEAVRKLVRTGGDR